MLKITIDKAAIQGISLLPKKMEAFTAKLIREIRKAVIAATPEDSGRAKESWTGVERTSTGYQFGNTAHYAHILETGSVPGKKPWPSVGPKTAMYNGRIYSSQAPGGIFLKADVEGIVSRALNKIGAELR